MKPNSVKRIVHLSALCFLWSIILGPSLGPLYMASADEEIQEEDGEAQYGAVEIGMIDDLSNVTSLSDMMINYTERKHVHFLYENGAGCKKDNKYGITLEYFHLDCGSTGVCSLEKNFTIRAKCKQDTALFSLC